MASSSSHSAASIKSHFFKIIASPSVELHLLSLPRAFAEEFGGSLSDHAYLRSPKGVEHKVDVMKEGDEVWFSEGWHDFAHFHSLGFGHFLVFKYEGRSRFEVLVFDRTCSEIEYPDKDMDEDYEDSDGGEEAETRAGVRAFAGEKRNSSALERARELESSNPRFVAYMCETYLSKDYRMWVPTRYAKKYLQKEEEKVIFLQLGEEMGKGRTWKVAFNCEVASAGRLCTTRLTTGWKCFAIRNRLQVGDACVFERIDEASSTYRVHIFRRG